MLNRWMPDFWNPWRRLQNMEREMNRLFGTYMPARATTFPPVNIWTNEEGAVVTAELPGVDPASIDVTAMNNTLTLKGERVVDEGHGERSWHRRERPSGRFARTIELPFRIDGDSVEAHYQDGVLRVSLARPEEQKPRKIAIQTA